MGALLALFVLLHDLGLLFTVSIILVIGGIITVMVKVAQRNAEAEAEALSAAEARKAFELRQREAREALKLRRMELAQKWGRKVADNIIDGKIWIGMTAEQLGESWGEAEETEQSRHKNIIKETWKYGQFGKNRFENRIFLEDLKVAGWKGRLASGQADDTQADADGPVDAENLEVGSRVKARWHNGEYYPGIIARVIETEDGARFDVNFDDGDKIKGLSIIELQPLASGPRGDPDENDYRPPPDIKYEERAWFFNTIGVPETATMEEIKAAYHKTLQLVHPDHAQEKGADVDATANQITKKLNAAYSSVLKGRR